MILVLTLSALFTSLLVAACPKLPARCTGTISSLADVAQAVQCSNVSINGFNVPAGSQLILHLADGATVNLNGDILFETGSNNGPLFEIRGNHITFNGNGHRFDGGGSSYWDGKGSAGGTPKPAPMMKIAMSGTFSNTNIINSPAQAVSVSNPAPLTITSITIDNSEGDLPNAQSNGQPAGRNTDGIDCSTSDLTVEQSTIINQDDCIAINQGSRITFRQNHCSGGHGISVGSINSGVTVSDIVISDNTIDNSDQALRIKTFKSAKGSTVERVTYSGNTANNIRRFGIIIDQSYPSTLGTPGSGVIISDIIFNGTTNNISVDSSATPVAINCGGSSCQGSWDWSTLTVSGGKANYVDNSPSIIGFTP